MSDEPINQAMTPFEAALIATLGRLAQAFENFNTLQAGPPGQRPAPNLRRKLEDYADFDPASIGAVGVAWDHFGWTELEWDMRIFKRYRSGDDDDKGTDIRFRRVKSGNVAEKNLVWETLIKFSNARPAKPLRGELAETINAAKAAALKVPTESSPGTAVQPAVTGQPPKPKTGPLTEPDPSKAVERPFAPLELRAMLQRRAQNYTEKARAATKQQRSFMAMMLEALFAGDAESKAKRHALQKYLTDKESIMDMTDGMILALLDWLKPIKDAGGDYWPDGMAVREAKDVMAVLAEEIPF